MWILKLTLTTLWMAGNAFGLTMGGLVNVLALVVVALVVLEGTSIDRRIRQIRIAFPRIFVGAGH